MGIGKLLSDFDERFNNAWKRDPRVLLRNIVLEQESHYSQSLSKDTSRFDFSFSPIQLFAALAIVLIGIIISGIIDLAIPYNYHYAAGGMRVAFIKTSPKFVLIAFVISSLVIASTFRYALFSAIHKELTIFTKSLLFCSSRIAVSDSDIRYIRLQATDTSGKPLMTPKWRVAVELNDGRRIDLSMRLFSDTIFSSAEGYTLIARRALTLSKIINAPLMFTFEGVDVIVNSSDDLPDLSETVKTEIQNRFITRISHYQMIRVIGMSVTCVFAIIIALLCLI